MGCRILLLTHVKYMAANTRQGITTLIKKKFVKSKTTQRIASRMQMSLYYVVNTRDTLPFLLKLYSEESSLCETSVSWGEIVSPIMEHGLTAVLDISNLLSAGYFV